MFECLANDADEQQKDDIGDINCEGTLKGIMGNVIEILITFH